MTIRTPKSSIASSLIKHILLHKWQQVVNTLFKVEEALPHLRDALTKAVKQEFKWFCHSSSTLTMKSPEEIMKFTNKALLNAASRKCPIYYSCILGTAGLIGIALINEAFAKTSWQNSENIFLLKESNYSLFLFLL